MTAAPRVLLYVPGGGFQLESLLVLRQLEGFDVALAVPTDSVLLPWMERHEIHRVAPLLGRARRPPLVLLRRWLRSAWHNWRAVRASRPIAVIAVGSSVCVPGLVAARLNGVPTVFIESITRTDTLSLTGRLVERFRLASRFYVQWPGQVDGRRRRLYKGTIL